MKVNFNNQINFCKQLKADCTVLKKDKPIPCKIYELTKEDREYVENKNRKRQWNNSELYESLRSSFNYKSTFDHGNIYVMEDNKNRCIGFARIKEKEEEYYDILDVIYIETRPACKKQKYKYIGETFINFLSHIAKQRGYNALCVSSQLKDAKPFYEKSFFEQDPLYRLPNNLSLEGENMEALIGKNEEHTGNRFDYIF